MHEISIGSHLIHGSFCAGMASKAGGDQNTLAGKRAPTTLRMEVVASQAGVTRPTSVPRMPASLLQMPAGLLVTPLRARLSRSRSSSEPLALEPAAETPRGPPMVQAAHPVVLKPPAGLLRGHPMVQAPHLGTHTMTGRTPRQPRTMHPRLQRL